MNANRIEFDAQPRLIGELVSLEPLQPSDLDGLHEVAADPLVWEQHPRKDRHKREVFEKFFQECLDSGSALAVRDVGTGRLIGSSRYLHDKEKDEIEIGWTFLGREYWGGWYNGELKRLMLRHAFRSVDTVVFLIGPENFRSRRAVEKLGARFVEAGTWPDGTPKVTYRLTASEYTG